MKTITHNKYGAPEDVLKFETVEMPVIKDDEVLVRVQAAATHIGDWLLTRGWPYLVRLMPKAKIAGMEMADTWKPLAKTSQSSSRATRFLDGANMPSPNTLLFLKAHC